MLNSSQTHTAQEIFTVGEFPAVLRSFLQTHLRIRAFKNASEFLAVMSNQICGCLIADSELEDGTGIGLHREIATQSIDLATIIVTRQPNSQIYRAAFRAGVFDVLSGPSAQNEIDPTVRSALNQNLAELPRRNLKRERKLRVDRLTTRELDVARLLSHGRALKEVGAELSISVQTASKHRSNIFSKLRVTNEVELYKTINDCIELLDDVK